MRVAILASGSSGNAVVVHSRGTTVLVDAGISTLAIRRRMAQFGHDVDHLDGVLVTHEHGDHVRGLEVLTRRHPTPVFATAGTWSALPVRVRDGGELVSGRRLELGALKILPVATSHDAREPVAMVIDDGTHRLAVCTDTGVFTTLLQQRLMGCDLLLLEANHDADMLRHGPYPWPLKQRIASRRGHLGNHQTLDALAAIRGPALQGVVGLHLSEENNRPDLVIELLRQAVGDDLPVGVATRHDMLGLELTGGALVLDPRPVPPTRRSRAAEPDDR